ncbi:PHP domain-containing protein [Candidatus Pacearchaeota archaeon]|nr:PHP domain-containing protein [Candidatus Pacearchaeota archaeon]
MKYIDLHTHTHYSDGISSPKELVRGASLAGMDILAKTDHDTLDGFSEAEKEAKKWGIILIPGVEFTTKKYHLLALNFDIRNKKVNRLLKKSRKLQEERAGDRIKKLQEYGVPLDLKRVKQFFPRSRIGKYNILMSMILDKKCRKWTKIKNGEMSPEEMLKFYLKEGGIGGNVEDRGVLEDEVINAVHEARGIVILAHPRKDIDDFQELEVLREKGIDGLEIQPNYENDGCASFKEYAEKNNMLVTYGSDYHGPNFKKRPLLARDNNQLTEKLREKLLEGYIKEGF